MRETIDQAKQTTIVAHSVSYRLPMIAGDLCGGKLTFGMKTRQRVMVVEKMMKSEMMRYAASGRSLMMKVTGTPDTHMITTLYTDIPAKKAENYISS